MDSIDKISADIWNALMHDNNPFNRHEYLAALESSKCVCDQTGWTPLHMVIRETKHANEAVIAVMPLYIKAHSYGEYVFDWAWADAYERHQLAYYPKLVSSVPFTPVSGMRLGVSSALTSEELQMLWLLVSQTLDRCLTEYGFSGWHCLFLPKTQCDDFARLGNLQRLGTQFHWFNRDYSDFQAFLSALTSRKRKDINKERQKVQRVNLSFEFVEGADVTAELWQIFSACYQQTYAKRSGHYGYLNLAFFQTLAESMPESIVLLIVRDSNELIMASALYFKSETHLYGRYWGALTEIDGLHFEACYYQGIEYCIANGLKVFDAGAQGEHKVPRGFEPIETYSNHEIAHSEFRLAIESFTLQEAGNIKTYMQQLTAKLPYKSRA
ncbi:GNAT family N-acetyltransferase [uncultured Shewanella sp.]|uniref:GNAT family N-acetyltransferase n=1 Tax=uncultured Shewanella sp. TaxID=173975 RepID=UPI0026174CEB|nr:GNAT family N-acetyltransferase [uncultured Shewanella sp.]